MSDQSTFLTEAILVIQNELQTALDYIETVVSQEPSQQGASPSLLTVDNLRIRIPFNLTMEQETQPIPAEEPSPAVTGFSLSRDELVQLKNRLLTRKGMLIGKEQGQLGRFARIRLTSLEYPPEKEAPAEAGLVGSIELTFTRIPRTLEPEEPAAPRPEGDIPGGNPVPAITGIMLDEAIKLLSSNEWQFEAHAATREHIAQSPEIPRGNILLQEPRAGEFVDKAATTVHFWVSLSNLPVDTIDGIGDKLGDKLRQADISNVGQLSIARIERVAQTLRINESRAREFIDMATFISHLVIAGLEDEVAELLVKGAQIRTMNELATSNPTRLHRILTESIAQGRVRVPGEFTFTIEDVTNWINSAQN